MSLFGSIKDFIDGKPSKEDEELELDAEPKVKLEPVTYPSNTSSTANSNLISAPVASNATSNKDMNLKVVKPSSYKDVKEVAIYLKNNSTVLLNLESADHEVSRRILDFLAGVTFTIGGTFQKVAKNTFVVTPPNVNIVEAPNKVTATSVSAETLGLSGNSGETLYN